MTVIRANSIRFTILDAISFNGAEIVSKYSCQDEAFVDRVSEDGIKFKLSSI